MDEVDIEVVADADLRDPLLVEGLPGVGHVGKLAAEHLVEEREGQLVRRVYSTHLPPQVSVEDGLTQLATRLLGRTDATVIIARDGSVAGGLLGRIGGLLRR